MSTLIQPLKWHGGKAYLAKWIVSLMPKRCACPNTPSPSDSGYLHFCEPYFGGGAVLLANDPEGISEVVNDLNGDLTNFWATLRDPDLFPKFQLQMNATSFCEKFYEDASAYQDCSPLTKAVAFMVRNRQSLAGRMRGFATITRRRTRRGMNEQVSAWLNSIEGLPEVHARLKRVLILNRSALDVIRQQDNPRTLFYIDPPYLHETRVTTNEYGQFEMTKRDHEELLDVLETLKGRFLLSGYHSPLYDKTALVNGWKCYEMKIHNHASGASDKPVMIECVWTNY
jgi:DNA adenine methylase